MEVLQLEDHFSICKKNFKFKKNINYFRQTDTSIWTIDAVTPVHRGHYVCQVSSKLGNHSAVTFLDSRGNFKKNFKKIKNFV